VPTVVKIVITSERIAGPLVHNNPLRARSLEMLGCILSRRARIIFGALRLDRRRCLGGPVIQIGFNEVVMKSSRNNQLVNYSVVVICVEVASGACFEQISDTKRVLANSSFEGLLSSFA
jgi:hypothetical protein